MTGFSSFTELRHCVCSASPPQTGPAEVQRGPAAADLADGDASPLNPGPSAARPVTTEGVAVCSCSQHPLKAGSYKRNWQNPQSNVFHLFKVLSDRMSPRSEPQRHAAWSRKGSCLSLTQIPPPPSENLTSKPQMLMTRSVMRYVTADL